MPEIGRRNYLSGRKTLMFPAPPLEGFVVVVQHKPDVVRQLEIALGNAGATVFAARTAAETIEIMAKYQAHLIVVDLNVANGVFNEQVVFAAFHRESGRICYSESFPDEGLITWATWLALSEPAGAVVKEAIAWRGRIRV
ncbi:hypothetical protein [Agrobacterium rosae]|uniref:hypothetical protein n=1 Tax=Agrobacterium rosae TaxID=1972867 RepID=UPI003BA162A1